MSHQLRMKQLEHRRAVQFAMQSDALQRDNKQLLKEHTAAIVKIDKIICLEVTCYPVENFLLNFEFSNEKIDKLIDFLQMYDILPEHNDRQVINYRHLEGLYNTYLENQE